MIKVIKTPMGELQANSYVVYDDESKNALIIDLGGSLREIENKIKGLGLNVGYALFTHGHFDHIFGISDLNKKGIKVGISEKDCYMLSSNDNMGKEFGYNLPPLKYDFTFLEGEYNFNGINVKVLETSGHTEGSCSFLIDGYLFTGDCLFKDGYGRCDFPSGDFNKMKTSLKRLLSLKGIKKVYTGHGEDTDINA